MKSLKEKLLKVNMSEPRVKVLSVEEMGPKYLKENIKALWWYNVWDNRLEYSEATMSHFNREIFKGPFPNPRGWVRGRVSQSKEKYYILILLEDWSNYTLENKLIADLYSQIQDKFRHTISDVVDEVGCTLTENKR